MSNTLRALPDDIDDPSDSETERSADANIRLTLLDNTTFDDLAQIAESAIYERLSLIDGIAEVTACGNRANALQVEHFDRGKMRSV